MAIRWLPQPKASNILTLLRSLSVASYLGRPRCPRPGCTGLPKRSKCSSTEKNSPREGRCRSRSGSGSRDLTPHTLLTSGYRSARSARCFSLLWHGAQRHWRFWSSQNSNGSPPCLIVWSATSCDVSDLTSPHIWQVKLSRNRTDQRSRCQRAVLYQLRHANRRSLSLLCSLRV